MALPDTLGLAYGISVIFGGLIGLLKAGSFPSFIAGVAFGAIIIFGAYQITNEPRNHYIMICASGFLALFMGYRFIGSFKLMPAGVTCLISFAMFARSLYVTYSH